MFTYGSYHGISLVPEREEKKWSREGKSLQNMPEEKMKQTLR